MLTWDRDLLQGQTRVKSTRQSLLFVVVAAVCAAGPSAHATLYSAAADFSISGNPNGVWSYGYSATLGSALTLYTNSGITVFGQPPNFLAWFAINPETTANDFPWAVRNEAATTPASGLRLPPGGLGLHPGPDPNNEYAVIRWTAPQAGMYEITAAFVDRDYTEPMYGPRGATSDVHVLLNGSSLYDELLDRDGWGFGPVGYLDVLSLVAGDQIDFVVGRGADDSYISDHTGLEATIVAVPDRRA
jgi:hypothetical protein